MFNPIQKHFSKRITLNHCHEFEHHCFPDDDEQRKKKKKKAKTLAGKVGFASSLRTSTGQDMTDRMKRTNAIAKKIINTAPPDGFCTQDKNTVMDPMDVRFCCIFQMFASYPLFGIIDIKVAPYF